MARIENVNIDGTDYDVGKIASTSNLGVVQVGSGLSITSAGVLSATGGTYSAGNGLTLTGTTFSADTTVLQTKLTAGTGISISNGTISCTFANGNSISY